MKGCKLSEVKSIKEQIRILVRLQDIDSRIYDFLKEKERLPQEAVNLEKIFEDKKSTLNKLVEKEKALALKRKEKELDLAAKEESIKKFNIQLSALKTNKEYQTMLGQITSLKTDNSVFEDDILKIMDEQDGLKEELAKEKTHLIDEEKKFWEEKKRIDEKLKQIEYSINDLTSKRNQIIPSLDKRIFSTYERILKGLHGLALVKVKDYSCQGCFLSVTPQLVNEIKMQDRIITCQSCARILYIEEDL